MTVVLVATSPLSGVTPCTEYERQKTDILNPQHEAAARSFTQTFQILSRSAASANILLGLRTLLWDMTSNSKTCYRLLQRHLEVPKSDILCGMLSVSPVWQGCEIRRAGRRESSSSEAALPQAPAVSPDLPTRPAAPRRPRCCPRCPRRGRRLRSCAERAVKCCRSVVGML